MTHSALVSGVFGLGIFIQTWLLLGKDISRKDIKELAKDMGISLLPLTALFGELIYLSYIVFCLCFALSFKNRILMRINEFSVLALNSIFLYYCLVYLGWKNIFGQMFFALILLDVIMLLKKGIGQWRKSFIYFWYIFLYLIIVLKNLSAIWPQASIPLIGYFIIGGLFLNIWVYICLLIDSILDSDNPSVRNKKTYNFLNLSRFMEQTGYNPLWGIFFTLICTSLLILNFKNHYMPEDWLVLLVLLLVDISSRRPVQSGQKLLIPTNNIVN